MDQIRAMRTFVRVADEGSFIGASRALDIAPPIVTRAIADLETHLGVRLISRTTRRLSLTDIGQRYLERVRSILVSIEEASDLAMTAATQVRGHTKLRAGHAIAVHDIAPRLARFHAAHPHVTVELSAVASVSDIDPAHDITILTEREPLDGDFVAHRLARTEVIACAAPSFLDLVGRPRHPSELADLDILALNMLSRNEPLCFTPLGGGDAIEVRTKRSAVSTADLDMNRAGALAGLGIACLPGFLARPELVDGRLERVLPGWRLFEVTVWACLPSRKHVPASTRALLDFLRREFGDSDSDPWAFTPESLPASVPRERLRLAA